MMKRQSLIASVLAIAGAVAPRALAEETRFSRAIQHCIDNPYPDRDRKGADYALALLATNQQVDRANEIILAYHRDHPVPQEPPYRRLSRSWLRAYLMPRLNALLTEDSKRAIEDMAFNYANKRSKIDPDSTSFNNAAYGPWFITGSENHDVNFKATTLLSTHVLCRSRPTVTLDDGRTAKQHYQAWVAYWKKHFRQRAREGLDCEVAHPSSYGLATVRGWYDVIDTAEDAQLKALGRQFLTLYWAQVAAEFEPRTGIRAAWASTRCYKCTWQQTGAIHWVRPLQYVYGWSDQRADPWLGYISFLTSAYRPPAIVTAIAADEKRGVYISTSRRFGRGGEWNAEDGGVYEVLFDDGEARNSYIRRDAYYTPDYCISAITFDPARDYIELVRQSRVMGLTFSNHVDDRIMLLGKGAGADASKLINSCAINGVCGEGWLIVARDPGVTSIEALAKKTYYNKQKLRYDQRFGDGKRDGTLVFISDGSLLTNLENDGSDWMFTRSGAAYCAIRIAHGGHRLVPSRFKNGSFLELEDLWSPVIIQMGRAADYPDGAQFRGWSCELASGYSPIRHDALQTACG